MMQNNGEYRTVETPLAAYLQSEGFDILIIEYADRPHGKKQATFVFLDSPQLREHISLYNRGDATANILLYEHNRQSLIEKIMRGLP